MNAGPQRVGRCDIGFRINRSRLLLTVAITAALAGCAMTPHPLTQDEISKRVDSDRSKMYADQDPITGPLSLAEVSARAMKYNLDYRLKLMEQALAQGTLDVTRWDMFPSLLLNAGYVRRSNDLVYVTPDGTPSTTTLDRNRRIASAEFSWNILDFGVSYYRAKMASDQVLVAEERKRKVMQNLMQDVRIAYWRALGAQRLLARMDALMAKSKTALARARQIEQQGLLPQAQALAYQRALLDSTVLLQARRQDLELAKSELAGLMNLPPGEQFTLLDNNEPLLPPPPANLNKLEEVALNQRPELREEDYKKRISVSDANRALVATLPGLSFDASEQYDSNRYLMNHTWAEGGIRLSMNLFRLASIPSLNRQRDAQLAVDDTRRMAQAMAVVTQVRVAAQRYSLAKDELDQVSESASVDQRLANYSRAAATSRVDSELEVIRTEARSLLSQYQREVAYSNAQAAYGRLFNSIGLDVMPPENGSNDLKSLTQAIDTSLKQWQKETFDSASVGQASVPKVALVVEDVANPQYVAAVKEGVSQALNRYNIQVAEVPGAWKMVVRVKIADQAGATGPSRRADWMMTMFKPNGKRAGTMSYSSVMPQDVPPSAINALSQSAIDSYSVAMTDWFKDGNGKLASNRNDAAHDSTN